MAATSRSASVLITGASGVVGEQLVLRFLERSSKRLIVILRQTRRESAAAKFEDLRRFCAGRGISERHFDQSVRLVVGEISEESLGLSALDSDALRTEVDAIMHCAAITRFSVSQKEARRVNRDGTRHVLQFAASCPRLSQVGLISTAFVAGRRTGLVEEHELQHDAGFVNFYEASKYEAELEARAATAELPIAVYRLSTILGEALTGEVRGFGGIHGALRLIHRGLAVVPGTPDALVHCIPTEFAADTIFTLFTQAFTPGQTIHVVAPPEKVLTLPQALECCSRCFESTDKARGRRPIKVPAVIGLRAFDRMRRSPALAQRPSLKRSLASLSHFAPQHAYPKVFASSLFGKMEPPALADYLPRIIDFCLRSRWGKVRDPVE